MKLNELRAKRNNLVTQARELLDKAEAEKRSLTAEESQQYDKLFADQEALRTTIAREERQMEAERELAGREAQQQETRAQAAASGKRTSVRGTDEYRDAFNALLTRGHNNLTPDQHRALSADVATQGGFIVAAEQFVNTLIQAVDDEVFVRRYATVIPLDSAASLGVPTLDNDPSDADWTSEVQTGNEDGTMSFGKREMVPSPLAKRIKVSNKLLARSSMPVATIVAQRLGYKFGIAQEKAFLLGSGANQPLGVFTPHNAGVPTGRDVATGNSATNLTLDGLVNAKYSLKAQHQKASRWLFHRDGVSRIAQLKDTTGQYLWQPAKKEGEPDMVLGLPIDMSEYCPNTFTTGKYVGLLANWKAGYWVADAMNLQIQVLKELYAETNQTGYIGRLETDGAPVLAEAFARVKLG